MFIGNLDVLSGENIRKMFESHGSQVDVINKSLTGIEQELCQWCDASAMSSTKLCEKCYDISLRVGDED